MKEEIFYYKRLGLIYNSFVAFGKAFELVIGYVDNSEKANYGAIFKEQAGRAFRLFGPMKELRSDNQLEHFGRFSSLGVSASSFSVLKLINKAYLTVGFLNELEKALKDAGFQNVAMSTDNFKKEQFANLIDKYSDLQDAFSESITFADGEESFDLKTIKSFLGRFKGIELNQNFADALKLFVEKCPGYTGLHQKKGSLYVQLSHCRYGLGDGHYGMIGYSLGDERLLIKCKSSSDYMDWSYNITGCRDSLEMSAVQISLQNEDLANILRENVIFAVPFYELVSIAKESGIELQFTGEDNLGEDDGLCLLE